jgi:hypothetical protein
MIKEREREGEQFLSHFMWHEQGRKKEVDANFNQNMRTNDASHLS